MHISIWLNFLHWTAMVMQCIVNNICCSFALSQAQKSTNAGWTEIVTLMTLYSVWFNHEISGHDSTLFKKYRCVLYFSDASILFFWRKDIATNSKRCSHERNSMIDDEFWDKSCDRLKGDEDRERSGGTKDLLKAKRFQSLVSPRISR